ncbi:MAG: hypothetical protein AMS21_05155 [Gemmatimonas sp. SG8_38_2]|nr:MAG: hypothetical protein AMS21_05155 [Gemmatimonas sp. SG8_38_2]
MTERLPVHLAHPNQSVTRWLACIAVGLLLVFTAQVSAYAQAGNVTGRVVDAELGEPLTGATVDLTRGSGSVVQQATTNDAGVFRFTGVEQGRYTLIVQTLGYETYRLERISVGDETFNVGTIELVSVAFSLNPIVVTVSREQEKALESPAAVYTVNAEQVEEKTATTAVDHVIGLPGVDNVTTGLQQHNVVARGLNNVFSGALYVLTDNRWASVPSLRFNAYNLIPPIDPDIERIEFVLGPGSALYGPNVDKGVMHIITQSPLQHQGTFFSLAGGLRGPDGCVDCSPTENTQGVYQGVLRHAGLFSDNLGYKVSALYFNGDDWRYVDPVEQFNRDAAIAAGASPDTLRIGARDFRAERLTADARVDWQLSDRTNFVFAGGLSNMMSSIEMTGLGAAQADSWTYWYAQSRFRTGNLFAQVYYNRSNAGDSFTLRDGLPIVDKSSLWAAQVQHFTPMGDKQRWTYGADFIGTIPDTEGTINGRNEEDDKIYEFGGYLQSETALSPNFDVILAARVDWHNKVDNVVFSPRAGVVWKPTQEHNFRATYNRAFSQPTSINLSLDLSASPILGPFVDYGVRTLGVPYQTGLTFDRSCGGLCIRSPFAADPSQFQALDVTPYWDDAITQLNRVLTAQGTPLPGALEGLLRSLDPGAAGVGSVLRTFNGEGFGPIESQAQAAIDIAPLVPSITNTFEVGYKGLIADKFLIGASVYWQRVEDFIGPLNLETPNAFLDPRDLNEWLIPILQGAGVPAEQIPTLIGGLAQMPLGTATWTETPTSDPTDLYLTYRNFGNVDLWGIDVGLTLLLGKAWTITGSYSLNCGWISSDERCVDFFPNLAGVDDVALNAPNNKGMLGVGWRNPRIGLGIDLSGRFTEGYVVSSGVYEGNIPPFTLLSANINYALPIATATEVTLTATNFFSCAGTSEIQAGGCGFRDLHQEMIGAPFLGRMFLIRISQSF